MIPHLIYISYAAGTTLRKENSQGPLHCTYQSTQENVEETCRKEGSQNILTTLDEQHNKYKLMESQLTRALQSMQGKIPEIEKTLQMIQALSQNKSTHADT
jgi:hypothetical protein